MLKRNKGLVLVSVAVAIGGAFLHSRKKRDQITQETMTSTLTSMKDWNANLQREIVRSHRDARDVCIAALSIRGVNKQFDIEMFNEIQMKFARTIRGSDLLSSNETGELFLLFPESGLDEGYEAIERLQETLPPTTSLAAGLAVWDHCETASELVTRAVSSMRGQDKAPRGKITVAETPERVSNTQ